MRINWIYYRDGPTLGQLLDSQQITQANGAIQCQCWANVVMLSGKGADQLRRHGSSIPLFSQSSKPSFFFTWPPKLNINIRLFAVVFSMKETLYRKKLSSKPPLNYWKLRESVCQETQSSIQTTRVGRKYLKGRIMSFLFFPLLYENSRVGALNQGRSG